MLQQRGFTLIEVLVSIVILAVGLVGIAGLQAQSLRSSQDSYFRTQANTFANDLADRMRANATVAASPDSAYVNNNVVSMSGSSVACAPCSAEQVAQNDLASLADSIVASNLPIGNATISAVDKGNHQIQYTINIKWHSHIDVATVADAAPCGTAGIMCFSTTIRISDEG